MSNETLGRQDARNCLEHAIQIIKAPCTAAEYREAIRWIGKAMWNLVRVAPPGDLGLRL